MGSSLFLLLDFYEPIVIAKLFCDLLKVAGPCVAKDSFLDETDYLY